MHAPLEPWYPLSSATYASPMGPLSLVATDRGLVNISFNSSDTVSRLRKNELLGKPGAPEDGEVSSAQRILEETALQLDQYFEGERHFFALLLDLLPLLPAPPKGGGLGPLRPRPNPWVSQTGTFRARAQTALLAVPYGETWSYGDLAAYLGNPGAARAVGTACATNPLPIVLPCHRITRSDGEMGHYTGGVHIKRTLLNLEGALK